MSYIEVYSGRFYCEHCGISWVGTWHGPKDKITCVKCKKPIDSSNAVDEREAKSIEHS